MRPDTPSPSAVSASSVVPTDEETTLLVKKMARREAAASLLSAPRVEWGSVGPSVQVRLMDCPLCDTPCQERDWIPPFRAYGGAPGPVLRMLACESVTIRSLLPIVHAARRLPKFQYAEFETRGLTWLAVSHLDPGAALKAVDAAEEWVTDPTAPGTTLPASSRRHELGPTWPDHRRRLVPSLLSPHSTLPPVWEELYAEQRRTAIMRGYERACPAE